MKTFRSDENQKEKKTQTTQSVNTKHTVKKKKPKKIYSAKAKKDTGKLANRINCQNEASSRSSCVLYGCSCRLHWYTRCTYKRSV